MTTRPFTLRGPQVRAAQADRLSAIIVPLREQPIGKPLFHKDEWWEWTDKGYGEPLNLPFAPGDVLDPAVEIDGYPDYCVTMGGRVYSRKSGDWQQLAQVPGSNGYPRLTLCKDGTRRSSDVHTLICEAFHGPRPSKAHQVRHLNGNRLDCAAANLCWGTQAENWADRHAHGNGVQGEKHHHAKFTDKERDHLRWGYNRGLFSQRHAARVLGVAQGTISDICAGGTGAIQWPTPPDNDHLRLTLIVRDVQVLRVQDVSEEQATALGYEPEGFISPDTPWEAAGYDEVPALASFADDWNERHDCRQSWDSNPWCALAGVTVRQGNVDAMEAAE